MPVSDGREILKMNGTLSIIVLLFHKESNLEEYPCVSREMRLSGFYRYAWH